jgi:DNA-directed RNA polymerase III subunit RPC4
MVREARINADKLHSHGDDEDAGSDDEATMAALTSRAASVMPMGIYRKAHKEAEVVVATTAELEAAENATGEEESLWVEGGSSEGSQPPPEQPPEEGVWDTGSKKPTNIKKEPVDDDAMDLDSVVKNPEEEKGKKLVTEVKIKKHLPQDPEDKRIQSDIDLLASELGGVSVTEDGIIQTDDTSSKDGRMYLFQFPPLLPPLKPSVAPNAAGKKVKAEPQDIEMSNSNGAVDLTEQDADVPEADDPEMTQGFMSQLLSSGGMIGQLKVRKSGKVELDWGGRTLEMSPAIGMKFASTAVIVEENDQKPGPMVISGEGIGMGKIMGRFLLAPTWGEEEDWVVPPEQLQYDQVEENGQSS